ncbi:site-specific integrase [Lysinibacillus sp. NPDC093197]|uniref:site-specific integrase n=1 Tax=Lysinibacillus sp. NPDC093197 TaxID=3364132 RepID=UPI00380312A1
MDNYVSNGVPVLRKNIQYKHFDFDKYKEMFLDLVYRGKIIGNFEDPTWMVHDKIAAYPMNFNFDIEIYRELNDSLKAYTILNVENRIATFSIYNNVLNLKKLILNTSGLTDNYKLDLFLEELNIKYSNEAYRYASSLKKFLNFYPLNNHQEILKLLKKYSKKKNSQRALPNFDDVLIFDQIVNDYFQNNPTEDTLKYLPIMVWWTITNIIPLRPSEFLMLKKNCLIIEEDNYNNSKKIIIPRVKQRTNEIEYDTIEIDDSAYSFLKNIIALVDNIDSESEDLFSIKIIHKFQKATFSKKNKRINLRDFGTLKEYFYSEIVEERYGYYNLDIIKTGDTRHFAIINMALQGFNMLSIARMAGHSEIRTQGSYYSHAEHFAQSYVYKLAQLKFEKNINLNMKHGITGWKRYIYQKGKILNEAQFNDEIVGKVDYGLCTENKSVFPKTCEDACKYCSKFVFSPSINEQNEALLWLTDTSKELEKKIREAIELMRDLSFTIASQFKSANYDLLKTTSRKIELYMNQKANIEALLMEARKHEH